MLEIERTFLAESLPDGLENCKNIELLDIYYPKEAEHSHLRLRKKGDEFEMTKKSRVNEDDGSSLIEETIHLTAVEFSALAMAEGKKVRKIRYFLDHKGKTLEIDVFQDELLGLVMIDVEFESVDNKDKFSMPDFCLADVTQEEFFAGGMLCGKSYEDIKDKLDKLGYKKF